MRFGVSDGRDGHLAALSEEGVVYTLGRVSGLEPGSSARRAEHLRLIRDRFESPIAAVIRATEFHGDDQGSVPELSARMTAETTTHQCDRTAAILCGTFAESRSYLESFGGKFNCVALTESEAEYAATLYSADGQQISPVARFARGDREELIRSLNSRFGYPFNLALAGAVSPARENLARLFEARTSGKAAISAHSEGLAAAFGAVLEDGATRHVRIESMATPGAAPKAHRSEWLYESLLTGAPVVWAGKVLQCISKDQLTTLEAREQVVALVEHRSHLEGTDSNFHPTRFVGSIKHQGRVNAVLGRELLRSAETRLLDIVRELRGSGRVVVEIATSAWRSGELTQQVEFQQLAREIGAIMLDEQVRPPRLRWQRAGEQKAGCEVGAGSQVQR